MSDVRIPNTRIDVRGGDAFCLVRDVLDTQLVDRRNDPMGRVDGIILAVAGDRAPQVTCVESGMTVEAQRVSRHLARWVRGAARRWGLLHGRPVRIAWDRLAWLGEETELNLDARRTRALAWEEWLLQHAVRYIPSLKSPAKKDQEKQPPPAETNPPPRVQRVRGRRMRVEELLGRKVVDAEGRSAGRIEELRAHVRDGKCVVTRFDLGREGLLERLSVGGVTLEFVALLGGRRGAARGHSVPWEQMDLRDPKHPRLRCRVADLQSAGET